MGSPVLALRHLLGTESPSVVYMERLQKSKQWMQPRHQAL